MSGYVVVNGVKQKINYQRCTRCISDSTCPGITFDAKGICNFCHLHDKWSRMYPNDERGQDIWNKQLKKIKRDGKGVPLPLPEQNLEQINIQGLFPVIINITPINAQTLPIFLGQAPKEPAREPELVAVTEG